MSAQNQLPNLDKIFRDDDEPDFAPSGGSNLAAIFGVQPKITDSHATKQIVPKKNNTRYNIQQTTSLSKTEVLIAKAVHAFKLQNGKYISMGKLGIALIGNLATRIYQIILYKNKEDYISVTTVTRDFVYTVQANNYASYYDNNKENWSILFEDNESYLEFVIEIGLSRYLATQEKGEDVIYQDLTLSEKDVIAKEGDSIYIKYFVGTEIVQPFKTNFVMSQTMTVEISTDNNWERSLLSSSKGLKRVLFLPPNRQISLGPGFPREKDVMLILEIIDIRVPEDNSSVPKAPTSGKASIISRMAKMGQPILPKMPLPSTTDSEDTEDDVPHKSPRHKKADQADAISQKKNLSHESVKEKKIAEKVVDGGTQVPSINLSSTYKPLLVSSSLASQWMNPDLQPPYFPMDNQIFPASVQTVNRTVLPALDPGINMLLSENRIANTEIRMGMSKISDNVQKLLDKNAATPTSEEVTLGASLKMFLDLQAQKNDQLPKSMDKIAIDKIEMRNRISTLEDELERSKEEKESLLRANKNFDKKIEELERRLTDANDDLKKIKQDLERAQDIIKQYKEENTNLEDKLSKCNKENTFQTDIISSRQTDIENKNKEIKHIMNETYHTLLDKLANESHSNLSFDYVKSIIANTIKHITLRVLNEGLNKDDKESEASKSKAVNPIVSKIIGEHVRKAVLTTKSNEDISVKPIETPRSTTIMPIFENEPPPVPLDDIDEVDSD